MPISVVHESTGFGFSAGLALLSKKSGNQMTPMIVMTRQLPMQHLSATGRGLSNLRKRSRRRSAHIERSLVRSREPSPSPQCKQRTSEDFVQACRNVLELEPFTKLAHWRMVEVRLTASEGERAESIP